MPLRVSSLVTAFTSLFTRRTMPVAIGRQSPPPVESDRPSKRAKLDSEGAASVAPVQNGAAPSAPARASSPKSKSKKQSKTTPYTPLYSPEEAATRLEEIMASPIEIPKRYTYEVDYRDKLVLAPMVRTGTLPTRLLSLYYGAGLVWSPEIVDKAIIGAERTVDPKTGVITYHKGQGPIFTTHPVEKPFLIFQVGSSDPALAVEAAKVVSQDVSGIDLNCGCPKPFSTHAGMGAALLTTPDLLLDILRGLLRNIELPISAKIRLLPDQPNTLVLAARILATGVRNLTVHCRTRDMRPGETAIWDRLADVVAIGERRGLPVICNGDGEGYENWETIRGKTGATGVMLARSAERNPSVFSRDGLVDTSTKIWPQLLNVAQHVDNPWGNTKFLLSQFKPSSPPVSDLSKQQRKEAGEHVARSKSAEELAAKLGCELGQGAEFIEELESMLKVRPEWTESTEGSRTEGVAAHSRVADLQAQARADDDSGERSETASVAQDEDAALTAQPELLSSEEAANGGVFVEQPVSAQA